MTIYQSSAPRFHVDVGLRSKTEKPLLDLLKYKQFSNFKIHQRKTNTTLDKLLKRPAGYNYSAWLFSEPMANTEEFNVYLNYLEHEVFADDILSGEVFDVLLKDFSIYAYNSENTGSKIMPNSLLKKLAISGFDISMDSASD